MFKGLVIALMLTLMSCSPAFAQEAPQTPEPNSMPIGSSELVAKLNNVNSQTAMCQRAISEAYNMITDGATVLPNAESMFPQADMKAKVANEYCFNAWWSAMSLRIEIMNRGYDRYLP